MSDKHGQQNIVTRKKKVGRNAKQTSKGPCFLGGVWSTNNTGNINIAIE
jgi:hypothetical protein